MMTRNDFRALRKNLPPHIRRLESEAICKRVLTWPLYQSARTVMAYVPYGSEVDISPLLSHILSSGKILLLPRCAEDGVMHAYSLSEFSQLSPGPYGILQPPEKGGPFPKEKIDLILAPGLAFDRRLNRMGQGGGYYDRYLQNYPGVCAGLAFRVQVVQALQPHPHDVPLDALITPEEIILQRKERS